MKLRLHFHKFKNHPPVHLEFDMVADPHAFLRDGEQPGYVPPWEDRDAVAEVLAVPGVSEQYEVEALFDNVYEGMYNGYTRTDVTQVGDPEGAERNVRWRVVAENGAERRHLAENC